MLRTTRHAQRRMQQRGIQPKFLNSLLMNADLERSVGHSCVLYRVSCRRAAALNIDDRLGHYGLIVSNDGALITVVPIRRSNSGARYRRVR